MQLSMAGADPALAAAGAVAEGTAAGWVLSTMLLPYVINAGAMLNCVIDNW
jgi:hypothetical protein